MGDITTLDLYIRVPPSDLPVTYAYGSEDQPNVRLVKEIEAAVENPLTSRTAARVAANLDEGLGSALVQEVFSELTQSADLSGKVAGVSGLLRSSHPKVGAAVLALASDTLPPDTQNQLSRELCGYRSTDASAVEPLATLVKPQYSNRDALLRGTCASGNSHAKNSARVSGLMSDPDPKIRYDALVGVAQYAMDFPVAALEAKHAAMRSYRPRPAVTDEMRLDFPTEPKFKENKGEYISYWKKWLAGQAVQWRSDSH